MHDPIFFTCDKCEAKIKTNECLKYHKDKKHKDKTKFFFYDRDDYNDMKEDDETTTNNEDSELYINNEYDYSDKDEIYSGTKPPLCGGRCLN